MTIPPATIAQTAGDGITLGGPTEVSPNATVEAIPAASDEIPLVRPGDRGNHFFLLSKLLLTPGICAGLPTADPHVVGSLWLSTGALTVSAG